ncbi:MAG: hypothetical protein JWP63_2766 [Candidatus Solibacter sp.]|nr:hypothetical protein [Candidatus Solibacter sp.]
MLLFVAWLAFVQDPAAANLPALLSRVAEEAEIFQQNFPKTLTQESLEQRTLMPASRFRPHIGKNPPTDLPKPRLVIREIVSEYTVGALKDSAENNLVELRQVISVDGRKIQSAETARHALSLGVKSPDDRLRKRMLEDFARYGLVDIATDYGTILLAFSKRGLQNMRIAIAGEEQVGADAAWVLNWQQITPAGGMLEFMGNQAARHPLEGRILLRKSDGLPLRVQAWTSHVQNGHTIFDQATVDYIASTHGFLTPVSVVHRHLIDGQPLTENLYRYEPFKMFSAATDIKFTELSDTTPPSPPVKK